MRILFHGVGVHVTEYLGYILDSLSLSPCAGAREAAFRNIKSIAECLADELINAAKVSVTLYCYLTRQCFWGWGGGGKGGGRTSAKACHVVHMMIQLLSPTDDSIMLIVLRSLMHCNHKNLMFHIFLK